MRRFGFPTAFYSFIHLRLYNPLLDPGLYFSFVIFVTQTVGLLERVISPSQGLYLYTRQHKRRINAHTDIHALSGIRIQDPSVRAAEDSSYLKQRGHRDRQCFLYFSKFSVTFATLNFSLLVALVYMVSKRTFSYWAQESHHWFLQFLSLPCFSSIPASGYWFTPWRPLCRKAIAVTGPPNTSFQ
jgi:uncharacterized membrane protein